jgi:predicted MFS family arabinose efflux permease
MTEISTGAAARPAAGGQQALALALLFLVSLFNYGDRFLISILIPPIKAEFGLSDTQVGVLTGIGFTLFYALMGIPIASLADRTSRRAVIGWSLAAWSALCAACGLVQNFTQLLIARVLLGVGEAGASPPSHALLAEIFPPHRRATALGIYTLGAPAGLIVGFSLGGVLADAYGWRVVLFVFGVPGLALAAAIFRWLPEPARTRPAEQPTPAVFDLAASMRSLARIPTLWHVILASSTFSFAWVSVLTWAPAYFTRTFQMPLGQVGPQLALVMGGSQFLALLTAGLLVDRLSRIDRRWYMWFGGGIVVLAAPFYALIFLAAAPGQAQAWLFAAFLLANMHTACALTVVQFVAGPNRRAVASACYLFLVNILSSLGPLVAGALSDAWAAELGTAALGRALLWVSVIFSVWCGLHGWLGGRSLPDDFAAADRIQ